MITGASGGIGSAIAAELSASGYRLALCSRTAGRVESMAAACGDAAAFAADFRDPAAVDSLIARVSASGPVDTLIHCAGGSRPAPFSGSTPAEWDALIAINLRAVIQITHAFLPGMIERNWGRVVCIASDAGRSGSRNEAVYAACKAGVIAFSKSVAREAGRGGVTCNAVSPGPTETGLLEDFRRREPEATEKLRKRIPLGRFARPVDIAAMVAYLCSDRAAYITGQTISVNGGLHMP